jgi:hypothetical protein
MRKNIQSDYYLKCRIWWEQKFILLFADKRQLFVDVVDVAAPAV